ncbi:uncharacterized protein LOC142336746 isoform X2 [Convolutriloba macropyga]|uniref:uncharacterized protein LOC142336746 isoform X2 n=1 Tax=Convolutriloba macropyga TaxID=536237 RepID=UPI003F520293
MSDALGAFAGVACVFIDVAVLVLTGIALGGGVWVEKIDDAGDFFTRAAMSYKGAGLFSNGDLTSMGMWRYFSEPGLSSPLPFRDPELMAGTACYIGSQVFGASSIILISFQVMGLYTHSVSLSLTILWTFFFQSNSVVVHYFQTTFQYEKVGRSQHVAWASFGVSVLNILIASFRLYLSITNNQQSETEATNSNAISPPMSNELRRQLSYMQALSLSPGSGDIPPLTSRKISSNGNRVSTGGGNGTLVNYRWSDLDMSVAHHRGGALGSSNTSYIPPVSHYATADRKISHNRQSESRDR